MEYVTKGLQPEDALRYFEEISAIPRGSGNEGAVARYICEVAEKAGLEATRDEANNVIVKKPASAGCENAAPVMLQGHMDMVCVKLPDCDHDFEKDPLKLKVEDGWLKAEGTTLGADNGSACAQMLALMTRKRLPPSAARVRLHQHGGDRSAGRKGAGSEPDLGPPDAQHGFRCERGVPDSGLLRRRHGL